MRDGASYEARYFAWEALKEEGLVPPRQVLRAHRSAVGVHAGKIAVECLQVPYMCNVLCRQRLTGCSGFSLCHSTTFGQLNGTWS